MTNRPPSRCAYSGSGAELVSLGYLPVFPVGRGVPTRVGARTALLGDRTGSVPPRCSLYIRIAPDGTTLFVAVAAVSAKDLCAVTKGVAATALSRVPHS